MKRNNNKALYEKIMRNVSKEVKRSLNESSVDVEYDTVSNFADFLDETLMASWKYDREWLATFIKELFYEAKSKNIENFVVKLDEYISNNPDLQDVIKYGDADDIDILINDAFDMTNEIEFE